MASLSLLASSTAAGATSNSDFSSRDRRPNSDTRRLRTTKKGFSPFFAAYRIGRFDEEQKGVQQRSFRRPPGFSPLRPAAVNAVVKAAAQAACDLPPMQKQATEQKTKQRSLKSVSLAAISSMPSKIPRLACSRTSVEVPEASATSSTRSARVTETGSSLAEKGLSKLQQMKVMFELSRLTKTKISTPVAAVAA